MMDEALKKSGDWPNVAITPGTRRHAATGEPVEQPESTRIWHPRGACRPDNADCESEPARVENGAHDGSECVDTREQLEADMRRIAFMFSPDTTPDGNPEYELRAEIMDLLDRQAAITGREYWHNCCQNHVDYDEEYKPAIDELTAERDNWANCYDMAVKRGQNLLSKIDELTAERDELREKNRRQRKQLSELQDAIHERNEGVLKRQWKQQVEELKVELEAQRTRANDAERGVLSEEWYVSRDRYEDDMAELKAERDYWKSQTRKCLEHVAPTTAPEVMEYPRDERKACEPSLLVVDTINCLRDFLVEAEAGRNHLRDVVKQQAGSFAKIGRELHELESGETLNTLRVSVAGLKSTVERQAETIRAQREELARFNREKRGKRRLPKHVAWPRHDDGKLVKLNNLDAKDIVFTRDSCLVRYHDGHDDFFAMDELRRRWKERK